MSTFTNQLKLASAVCFFLLLFVGCTTSDDDPGGGPQIDPIPGTYCLDFSLVGSQMTIEATDTENAYTFTIADYDGGLRSGSGTATVSANVLTMEGTMQIEFGQANFTVDVDFNEATEKISGEFVVLGPGDVPLISSSINGTKGACSFSLSPNEVDEISGEAYLTDLHVELDKIKKISKYRSAAGHNFVDYSGESCVNLKHYFHTYAEGEVGDGSQLPSTLDYFSPAAGTVVTIVKPRPSDDPTDFELDIRLDANENVIVRIFHVNLLNNIRVGDHLDSGQPIGSAPTASLDAGDFAVYVLTDQGYRHISMFEIMSGDVLNQYRQRGVSADWKSDLYYERSSDYATSISCENGDWGNLRHPQSRFELDYFFLDD